MSAEALELIDAFGLANRPEALEISAVHVTIEAIVSGRTCAAVSEIELLLQRAGESGWSSTASRLGAVLVGLNCVSGDYTQAIYRYRTISPLALRGARPGDRSGLMMETAHAYTMSGRPNEALSLIGYVRPGDGCPRAVVPGWHASRRPPRWIASANTRRRCERRVRRSPAIARRERSGASPMRIAWSRPRTQSSAMRARHTNISVKLAGWPSITARPMGCCSPLSAESAILQNAVRRLEAAEYAKLLHQLARS